MPVYYTAPYPGAPMPTSNAKLTESAVQGLIKLGNPPQKRKNTRRRKNRKSRNTRRRR